MILSKEQQIEMLNEDAEYRNSDTEFTQWGIVGDGSFVPNIQTIESIKSGLYELVWNSRSNEWAILCQKINTDELYELPTEEIGGILNDIKSFWLRSSFYKKYNLMHKRGILLYGDPGCGKSGIIQLCMKHIINELSGVVINLKDEDSIKAYAEFIPKFRQIEPSRPLVVIMEDIESIAGDSSYSTSVLLNILDGIKQIENVVYIATTNYPEKLEERITNRPSRFDRRYYISPPSENVRRAYLENKIGETDLDIEIEKWVKDTEGLSISHLKELFISVILLENSYEESIENLKGMKIKPRGRGQKSVGFHS